MKRSTGVVLATIAALAAATWLVFQRPGERSLESGEGAALVSYDSAAADGLVITGSQGTVRFERQAGRWMMTEPMAYRADETAVGAAIGKGRSLTPTTLVSSNPAKQSLFQVDSTGTLVTVLGQGRELARFRVGKPAESYRETYLRLEGSDDVYLVRDLLAAVFSRSVKDWRDRTVFRTDPNLIRSVTYRFGDTTFALLLQDSVWTAGGRTASQPAVRPLLNALANLQADAFIDTAVIAPPPLAGTIEIGETRISFHRTKDAPAYLVRSSAGPQWYEMHQWRAHQALKRLNELLPPS